jgi:transposase
MDVNDRCRAGLDVHKATVVACVRRVDLDGHVEARVRTFATTTGALLELGDWLVAEGVARAAMESTGVSWKPVYYLLEGRLDVMPVNAQHIKQVPGRKADVRDRRGIAELLQFGLLRRGFVPPPEIRELRDLTRQRSRLVADRARACLRLQKVLEGADIELASVATDILGVSGRAMIRALIDGETDPARLAAMARGRMRAKIPAPEQAMRGRIGAHHRFMLETLPDQIESPDRLIGRLDGRPATVMGPMIAEVERLRTIPGVDRRAAEVIVAEIGTDMGRSATAGHLCSWAGMGPGNGESAGKRRSGSTTPGSRWLRSVLVQAAWAASHTKRSIPGLMYRRRVKRMGKKRALVALGHKILTIVYNLLKHGADYIERLEPGRAA